MQELIVNDNTGAAGIGLFNGGGLAGGLGSATSTLWALTSTASMAASAYHGYRRNKSIGWAIVWGLLGGAFPVLVPAVAVAQGYGKRA